MRSALDVAFAFILAIWFTSKVPKYLENQHLWTLRLRLSTLEYWSISPTIFIVWSLLAHHLIFQFPPSLDSLKFAVYLLFIAGIFVSLLEYVLPVYHSRRYLLLRWKAWTGPSRTGIRADLVPYIGDRRDWETLQTLTQGRVVMHPVEKFCRLSSRRLIVSDPTDLLLARASVDQTENTLWVPHSDIRPGVFQPIVPGEPTSLLWGEQLGFQRRCSRAIISLPRDFVSAWPKLAGGIDARGICLACGILARNKGLNPTTFVCNLQTKRTFGAFEQNSVFWPRPAKTLRSLFRGECERLFSGLGPVFVIVATELALLLTDASAEVAEDWLEGQLEHQDLELNNEAYALGAGPEDLDRLYRGHYATMLVSLSVHRVGVRVRPEMLVYHSVCRNEGALPNAWATSAHMEGRRQRELEVLGPRVMQLVDAVV